jgi:hypothetical protein
MIRVPRILVITVSTLVGLWLLTTFVWVADFKTNLVLSISTFIASQSQNVTMDINSTATVLSLGGPASIQFSAWLAAFNSHDRPTLLAYHAAHFPYDVASGDISNIHREMALSVITGGFDFIEIPNASGAGRASGSLSTIHVILREKKGQQYVRAMMQVDLHKDDHPVTKFEINPTHTPIKLVPEDRKKEFEKAVAPLTPAWRKCVVKAISDAVRANYIFPDAGEKMIRYLETRLQDSGDYHTYEDSEAFARRVMDDMQTVSGDKHILVDFSEPPPNGEDDDSGGSKPQKLFDLLHEIGFGFRTRSIEMIQNKKLGFLPIDGFVPSTPEIASDSAAIQAAISDIMSEISDADALIIDLRNNGGGSPETVAFVLSYLLDGAPVHLNDFVDRNGTVRDSFSTMTEAELPENAVRFGGSKPLFVLTSKETVSGGEEMAYDLQALKRASCIIGEDETTTGAAHPVMGLNFLCEEEFGSHWWVVGVPIVQPVNGVTGTNWEGVGVRSEVVVGNGEDAKTVGRRMAMEALGLGESTDEGRNETPLDL